MRGRSNIIERSMRYYPLVILITTVLVAIGVFGLRNMPKQEFPDFTIRQGLVVGVYAGATSLQVEEELAKPLERFLFTYKEVKRSKTYSVSKDGVVYVYVELVDNIHEKDRVWSKIKLGLQSFKQQLPPEVLALVAQDDFGDTSAILLSMESDEKNYRELEGYMEMLEDRLLQIESVSSLRRYGIQREQISIYVDKRKLAGYGIDERTVLSELSSSVLKSTGGKLNTGEQEMPIYFAESYQTEQDVANKVLYIDDNGNSIRIKDIAEVRREYPDADSYIKSDGKRTVLLSMEMRTGFNIIKYGEQVDEVLDSFVRDLPQSVEIKRIADQPKVVSISVYSFLRDLALAIVIVIAVMLLLFPWRSAVIAGTTIPITIFITLGIMYASAMPLNTVTLAALIVVLGMIVDNSIVVLDGYLENLDNGMSRWYAAIYSAKRYFGSILLATLCISVIFFPFLFVTTGMIRDFLTHFPWTLFVALMVSVVVSMVVIPILEYFFIKRGLRRSPDKRRGFSVLDSVQNGYNSILKRVLQYPRATIALGVLSVAAAILIMLGLDIRLMPNAERDQFAVEIYLPEGASLNKTAEVCESMQEILSKDERVTSITSFVGMGSPRFQATYAPNMPSKNYGQFIVNTTSSRATIELLDEYANRYSNHFPNAYVRFKQLDYNTAQTPVEVRFHGDDVETLKREATSFMEYLHTIPELSWIHTSSKEPLSAALVDIDPVQAARLSVNTANVSLQLAMLGGGFEAGEIWESDYRLPLILKSGKANQSDSFDDPSLLEGEYINTPIPTVAIPLRKIAEVKPVWSDGEIVRRGALRTISVIADYKREVSTAGVNSRIVNYVEEQVAPNLPKGVSYSFGGYEEFNNENLPNVLTGLLVAAILIFFFLLLDFKRIGISLVSLASLSLCLLGAALALWILGIPIAITAILGIVSLMGIVARNVILIFHHADELRINKGWSALDAAYDAGRRRMVPIFLTSMTTAVGVVPMILSKSPLWYPMGTVICYGTISSMILVVLVLPAIYSQIYKRG